MDPMDLSLFNYDMFLIEQNQEKLYADNFINECIMIAEGANSIKNIQALNESFADKIKINIKKVAGLIIKLWNKFLESLDTLFKRDKAYLEKYKDVILKKKPVDAEYTMYNYEDGIKLLVKTQIPAFDYQRMKDNLQDQDKFISSTSPFNTFAQGAKAPYDINELAKIKFRGGSKEITKKASQINMTDLYNYCYGYNDMKNLLRKDMKYIEDAANDAIALVDKMVRENKIKNEASGLFEDAKYYSNVYNTYITEEENPNDKSAVKPGQVTRNTGNSNTSNNQDNKSDDNTKPDKAYQGVNKDQGKEMTEKDADGQAKDISSRISVYLRVCGNFIAAKETVAEEAYKAYMQIIKAHVRDHVGNEKNADTKQKDAGTNYDDVKDDGKPVRID